MREKNKIEHCAFLPIKIEWYPDLLECEHSFVLQRKKKKKTRKRKKMKKKRKKKVPTTSSYAPGGI